MNSLQYLQVLDENNVFCGDDSLSIIRYQILILLNVKRVLFKQKFYLWTSINEIFFKHSY